jgi:phosphohistidine swiveling domain-containing protein
MFGISDPVYVGGYHIEKVIDRFPELRFRYQAPDDRSGELAGVVNCEFPSSSVLLVSASTVLLPGACELLRTKTTARGTYGDGRPVGAYYVAADRVSEMLDRARSILVVDRGATLETLFSQLPGVEPVKLDGVAVPVTDRETVVETIFRGKAQTLDHLAPVLRSAAHLPRERILLTDWQRDPDRSLTKIQSAFSSGAVVVRSSAGNEDEPHSSAAGKYLSVLDVDPNNRDALRCAIDDVVASYSRSDRALSERDEVLVQPQIQNPKASGVLLTRDPRTGAPYFVVNEDRLSGRSDMVTSGAAGVVDQQFVAWSRLNGKGLEEQTRRVLALGSELIELSRLDALDVEYAFADDDSLHLLQARPLAAVRRTLDVADDDVLDLVAGIGEFVSEKMTPIPGLAGNTTAFGVMPDWNPAEMIGLAPRPMALSLYQLLIGNDSWAEARRRIGYRDTRPERLIVSLGGRPYVDVRASLNSFLPAALEDDVARRWVDACLERLKAEPAFHDKLEFEIAVTCLSPDWDEAAERLVAAGIDASAFRQQLRALTDNIISGVVEPIDQQLALIGRLQQRRDRFAGEADGGVHSIARTISQLLEDCRLLGVVPFSILARYAFISMNFLRGLRSCGAIDESDYQAFLVAVPTVAGTIADDICSGVDVDQLVTRYGHLRPNSYEITLPNYAADPGLFFRTPSSRLAKSNNMEAEAVLATCISAIERSLADLGLAAGATQLISFMNRSIAGRERAKFEFMKNVNAVLEAIAKLGRKLRLSREEMSFLEINDVLRLETHSLTPADSVQLRRRAAFNKKRWMVTQTLRLPDLIRNVDEVSAFRLESWRANFITRKCITAPAVWLDEAGSSPKLSGAIVITRAADPGHDWIFAHGIAGLITEYGGVASHMSIRAAEFGLPAAIGCGAATVELLQGAKVVELDCASEQVRRVS